MSTISNANDLAFRAQLVHLDADEIAWERAWSTYLKRVAAERQAMLVSQTACIDHPSRPIDPVFLPPGKELLGS